MRGTPSKLACPKCKRGKFGHPPAVRGVRPTGRLEVKITRSQHSGHGHGGASFSGRRGEVECLDCGHKWYSTHPDSGRSSLEAVRQAAPARRQVTAVQWRKEGVERFGEDIMLWRFACPVCGRVTSVKEWRDAGASDGEIAFSCVGRHVKGAKEAFADGDNSKGCSYAGGGLFQLNPVTVIRDDGRAVGFFEFAEVDA